MIRTVRVGDGIAPQARYLNAVSALVNISEIDKSSASFLFIQNVTSISPDSPYDVSVLRLVPAQNEVLEPWLDSAMWSGGGHLKLWPHAGWYAAVLYSILV